MELITTDNYRERVTEIASYLRYLEPKYTTAHQIMMNGAIELYNFRFTSQDDFDDTLKISEYKGEAVDLKDTLAISDFVDLYLAALNTAVNQIDVNSNNSTQKQSSKVKQKEVEATQATNDDEDESVRKFLEKDLAYFEGLAISVELLLENAKTKKEKDYYSGLALSIEFIIETTTESLQQL